MININTDTLQDVMATLESATNSIDQAAAQLQRITTHTNWGCAERTRLNAAIQNNRKEIQRIQSASESFLNTAKSVSNELVSTESTISQMFSSVESALAQSLADPVASTSTNTVVVDSNLKSVFNADTSATSNLSVVNLSSINL
jgi:chromosome segregation ATPase